MSCVLVHVKCSIREDASAVAGRSPAMRLIFVTALKAAAASEQIEWVKFLFPEVVAREGRGVRLFGLL